MNNDRRLLLVCIVVIIGLIGCNIYLNNQNHKLQNSNETASNNNETSNKESNTSKELEYDCSFTRTYHIVNLLDNYIAEVPELSYIVLDSYQSHSAFTHIIPTRLKKELTEDKYYEFTYTIKGTGIINDISDALSYISSTELANQSNRENPKLQVSLEIKETDKQGMGQIQEPICKGK